MKVMVEISDDQVVAVLQETIRSAMKANTPDRSPILECHIRDFAAAIEYCEAANRVIRHFGGCEVDYAPMSLQDGRGK